MKTFYQVLISTLSEVKTGHVSPLMWRVESYAKPAFMRFNGRWSKTTSHPSTHLYLILVASNLSSYA